MRYTEQDLLEGDLLKKVQLKNVSESTLSRVWQVTQQGHDKPFAMLTAFSADRSQALVRVFQFACEASACR